jgi:hypothetical protein
MPWYLIILQDKSGRFAVPIHMHSGHDHPVAAAAVIAATEVIDCGEAAGNAHDLRFDSACGPFASQEKAMRYRPPDAPLLEHRLA